MDITGRPGFRLFVYSMVYLTPMLTIFISVASAQWNGSLSAYEIASFDNPITPVRGVDTQLDHFAVHPETGDVYIGALNFLYRLNENLKQVANRSTGRNEERYKNYNKILVLQGGRVIECGSEDRGKCYSRREEDLGADGDQRDEIVAFGEKTTVGVVAPGPGGQRLYVAATVSQETGYQDIAPYSRRYLAAGGAFLFGNAFIRFSTAYRDNPFLINLYLVAFNWKGFTYFVALNKERAWSLPTTPYLSKLVRVCHTSDDLDSYTEILIECQGYRLIQAAHVGPAGSDLAASMSLNAADKVLYAVFARSVVTSWDDLGKPAENSAVCVYRMSDIEYAFTAAVRGCLTEETRYQAGYLQDARCPGSVPSTTNIDRYLCDADGAFKYASGILPVVQSPVVRLPGHLGSSIITSTERNHTIAYIGTAMGQLLKVLVDNGSKARLYEQVHLDGNPVRSDTTINETSGEMLVLTKKKLIRMRVENCRQYTTCESCIGTEAGMDGDPYCGWCTLERKCTRYDECPMPDVSTRWLAYNEAQCIEITDVAPHHSLPITVTSQQIILTVQRLPDLPNDQQYNCKFQTFSNISSKSGDKLQCTTPPGYAIPSIENGEDHVTVELRVHSTETGVAFVETEFSFYECGTHKSCVSCVGSRWACNWCVFENQCTHNNATCGSDDTIITGNNTRGTKMEGPDACPQIQRQFGEILVPNGVGRLISFNTFNLPNSKIIGYECSLTVDGTQHTVAASPSGAMITCNMMTYTYSANEQDLNVILTLKWIDVYRKVHVLDDRYGYTVTLYKCEVDRPDCSRCVSNENTRAELACVWCKQTCVVDDGTCAGDEVTPINGKNCPNPVIQQIYPTSGPMEGNTIITVTGTDLGRQFNDILNVTVGGQLCNIRQSNDSYKIGSSVDCITKGLTNFNPQNMQDVLVTITGADGSLQTSTGKKFQYKDPVISGFSPSLGIEAGGTLITVTGSVLNTGRDISAVVGKDVPCSINQGSLTVSSLQCYTGHSTQGNTGPVSVVFDGAVRTLDKLFTFTANPSVQDVQPRTSYRSGGRTLRVNGTGFEAVQVARIVAQNAEVTSDEEICDIQSNSFMECRSPALNLSEPNPCAYVSLDFQLDGFDITSWKPSADDTFSYCLDPVFSKFTNDEFVIGSNSRYILEINGHGLDEAFTADEADINVTVGSKRCPIEDLLGALIRCKLPENEPPGLDAHGDPNNGITPTAVVHWYGDQTFTAGVVVYPSNIWTILLATVVPTVGVVLLALIVVLTIKRNKQKKILKEYNQLLLTRIREFHEELQNLAERSRQSNDGSTNEQCPPVIPGKTVVLNDNISIVPGDLQIKFNQLKMGKVLGQGAFGIVYQATLNTASSGTERQVAVKTIQDTSESRNVIKFLEEGLMMKNFDHPNVLELLGLTFDSDGQPLIVLPIMANGDLKSYLVKRKKNPGVPQLVAFALHIARGMKYLSERKFVHRDLAARNCMIDDKETAKIADFGLSRDLDESDYYTSGDKQAKLPVKWMAPESMERKVYNMKTDVWSYGVLLWELFSRGRQPYPGVRNRDVYDFLQQGRRMDPPGLCPPKISDIMQQCWRNSPKMRCTFGEIVEDLDTLVAVLDDDSSPAPEGNPGSSDAQGEVGSSGLISGTAYYNEASYLQPIVERTADSSSHRIPMEVIGGDHENDEKNNLDDPHKITPSYFSVESSN